jgi:drug/metabolite transporter (DMT)-like permease
MTSRTTPNSQLNKGKTRAQQLFGAYGVLLVLSLIWGMAFVAIRRADFELSPVNLTLLRWLVASAGFLAIAPFLLKPKVKLERRDLLRLVAISLLNVPAYHLSLNFAEKTVSSGVAAFLTSLGPIFIAILSTFLLKEKIGKRLVFAIALGISGTVVLAVPDLNLGSAGSILGPLMVLVTALSYATFSVLAKPLVHKYGSASVTIWAGLIGTASLLPLLSPSFKVAVTSLSADGWISVLFLSLFSTVAGYMMFYALISRSTVSRLSIQMYLIPVVSVIGGIILLQEGLNIYTIIGGAILLCSVALATKSKT